MHTVSPQDSEDTDLPWWGLTYSGHLYMIIAIAYTQDGQVRLCPNFDYFPTINMYDEVLPVCTPILYMLLDNLSMQHEERVSVTRSQCKVHLFGSAGAL